MDPVYSPAYRAGSSPAHMDRTRPRTVLGKSTPGTGTPPIRVRGNEASRPPLARTQTAPANNTPPMLRTPQSNASSRTASPALGTPSSNVRATQGSGSAGRRAAFQGTVHVAGMRRSRTVDVPSPSVGPTLGTGARVVGGAARSGTTPILRPGRAPVAVPLPQGRSTRSPATSASTSPDASVYREKPCRIRSPTSPTAEVRAIPGTTSPRARTQALPDAHCKRTSPFTPSASPSTYTDSEGRSSPTHSALGTPSTHGIAHPFTPHQPPTPAQDRASTPPGTDAFDAKRERKLLDLEISNKSLLAINETLETTKVKQTKELRVLREQLHVGQLERAVDTEDVPSLGMDRLGIGLADLLHTSKMQDKESLPKQVARAFAEQEEELQEIHVRCRTLVDTLLDEARAAILAQPEKDAGGKSRVLHISELSSDELAEELAPSERAQTPSTTGSRTPVSRSGSPEPLAYAPMAEKASDLSVD